MNKGYKESKTVSKPPVRKFFKQFPNALAAVAERSGFGHEKYEEWDSDWSNWKRVENAKSEYEDAAARHALCLDSQETEIEHLAAEIWNLLAVLELELIEIKNDRDNTNLQNN